MRSTTTRHSETTAATPEMYPEQSGRRQHLESQAGLSRTRPSSANVPSVADDLVEHGPRSRWHVLRSAPRQLKIAALFFSAILTYLLIALIIGLVKG